MDEVFMATGSAKTSSPHGRYSIIGLGAVLMPATRCWWICIMSPA
jgi:hypothetical protein